MSLPSDDILTRPLGVAAPIVAGFKGRLARLRGALGPRHLAIGAGGIALLLAALLVLLGDPHGGDPRVTVAITMRPSAPAEAKAAPAELARVAEADPPPVPTHRSAEEVESASGVVVVRPSGTAAPSEAVVIRVPTSPVKLAPAPDPRLIERGRHGALPKMGEGRLRPLDVYARPEEPGAGPRVAILLTGLGIGQSATAAAIAKLPPSVSLAFAPYGGEVERSAARAREFGHEILLQAPMEPFDYPDSDPGPQTLLTSLRPAENGDRLAWVMSRFPGYVGLVNLMGARLLADAGALEPALKEVAARGLGFVDDGTGPRGLPPGLAGKLKLPSARAEIVLDAVPRADAIDRELARLEAQARASKGIVLASASSLPLTVERIARWARDLEARGLRLVPVSAILRPAGGGTRLSKAD
ncbi:divergent polysaccharide deacetylase family protein [Methylobacterium planeticum]|uniref:Divergent polysaccharide deacetylase family protein n=1 Tax=Methylobacterium planeticum TaxID=2615211 RepID=A0A6N6MXH3_9HYPH|nr:divergent polysaccharide deacetylase family protein [Methylobacterium planeticum]KAB1076149.1 divergent polysaccharide deacetylase family protein [Methylobacterium planeticum]